MQKHSTTVNTHNNSSMHFPPPEEGKEGRQRCPIIPHVHTDGSESRYKESMFDKNEMYQRRRVLQQLRSNGQLRRALPGMAFCPGMFYEMEGEFRAMESKRQEEQNQRWEDTLLDDLFFLRPQGTVWLISAASERHPASRLLCNIAHFTSELGPNAWQEFFCLGAPLPLRGVAVCLQQTEHVLVGLPLFLMI